MIDEPYADFVRLMSRHQRQIWWFINTLLPAVGDADDVLQETSLVLWRKWEEYDRDREFLNWALGVARLQVLRHVRENCAQRLYLSERVLAEVAADAERRLTEVARVESRLDALRTCLEKLGDGERRVVEARYLDALSTKRIAEDLGKPLASVYTVLRRTRVQLLHCVSRQLAATGATS